LEILILIAAAVIVIWIVISFNLLVRDKNRIKEAWSGIDVQLKRRHNLIPNLIACVKGYSEYERNLFEELTEKRSKAAGIQNRNEMAPAESDISGMLKNLIIVAENYPDLKANQNFLDLQKQLVEIEDQLQYARRYYNGTVRNYNTRVESFPTNLIAGIFNFKQENFFEITLATEKSNPGIKL
jgi:LemA protein